MILEANMPEEEIEEAISHLSAGISIAVDPNRKVWLDAEAIGKWMGISDRHVRRIAMQNAIPKKGQLYDVKAFQAAHRNDA